jgi:hypothetical protein
MLARSSDSELWPIDASTLPSLSKTVMTSESGLAHVEFDPKVKWPAINQVNIPTPG